jgi:hypothetical protein
MLSVSVLRDRSNLAWLAAITVKSAQLQRELYPSNYGHEPQSDDIVLHLQRSERQP